jgi:FKBP-type peptidyl-prolyl cis-trans isomerase FkpA
MNVVNSRKALSRAVFVAIAASFAGAVVAQQPVPTPAPSNTPGPVPLPAGTSGPMPPKPGDVPVLKPMSGAAALQPLPKASAGLTPPGPTSSPQEAKAPNPPRVISKSDALPAKVTELTIRDDESGSGVPVLIGQAVSVQYTGWLYDASKPEGKGAKFDSSRDRQLPFGFIIGAGRVIKGWDQGVAGMKPKSKRTLIVPPQFGYGDRAKGDKIPANSTLLFEVELVDVLTPPAAPATSASAPIPLPPTPAAGSAPTPQPIPITTAPKK